ncbi:MAG: outer membrane lipoprotein carrier protein LolA [Bacteriovoracaceae bacterium]|nr:outer membrane lipoprotein carrier protein LolA [Bacteriovoracaceae bacterium]
MKKSFVLFCMFLLWGLNPAICKSSRKNARLFLPKSFSAQFVQKHKSLISKKIKTSNGKIYYKYPSNIRLEMEKPNLIVFVSNVVNTWFYEPSFIKSEPGQVTLSSTDNNGLSKFFDVLVNGLVSNRKYKVKKNDELYYITFFKKMKKELGVKEAVLRFTKNAKIMFRNLRSMSLTYSEGKQVTLEFRRINPNAKFDDKTFVFKIPPNTNVVH